MNGSWRLACSLTSVLFGDASHHSLMTDGGSYMYCFGFTGLLLFVFRSLLMYGTIFSYDQTFYFLFRIIYSAVSGLHSK